MAPRDLIADLESALPINEHALDDAIRRHPDAFYRVSKELAMAVSERDAVKQNVKELEAELDAKIRREAAAYEERTTEREIEARKIRNVSFIKANNELLKLNSRVGLLQALKDAFQQRSYAMGQLVDLYVSGYYSEVSGKRTAENNKTRLANQVRAARREHYGGGEQYGGRSNG